MKNSPQLKKIDAFRWEIPAQGAMHVPGIIYASEKLIPQIMHDQALQQVEHVAAMPGIINKSLAMPDIHWGYGFPIGGVAAFDQDEGVISPGGIGYDISCGVRLMRTDLTIQEIEGTIDDVLKILFSAVPSGVGSTGKLKLSSQEIKKVLAKGARWAIEHGYGTQEDEECIEDRGFMEAADPEAVSPRATKTQQKSWDYFRDSWSSWFIPDHGGWDIRYAMII